MSAGIQQRRSDIRRGKFAVSVDPQAVQRIDELVDRGVYRSRSHGFDVALSDLLEKHDAEQESAATND